MKTIFRLNTLLLFTSLVLVNCKKEETKLYYNGGTPPVLTAVIGAEVNYANADEIALTLNWTNPDYEFTTGVSSLDVTYKIEIDTLNSNFTNPSMKVITISKDLTYSFTSSALNDIMQNQLNLLPSVPHTLEIRVVSSLGSNNSAELMSDPIQYVVTPYVIPPKVTPPASGTLYITGSASQAGWQCGCGDAPPADQTFTQVTPTLYELTTTLTGGGSYLFIPRYGTWNAVAPDPEKYGGIGANNTNNVNGDEFKAKGSDLLAPPLTATYKIVVDFQKGKFTVTKQ